jgi:hypothetical protein
VLQLASTHTGALTLTGACTAAAGSTDADPTCAVPTASSADWPDDWSAEVPVSTVAAGADVAWAPELDWHELARQTGAFTFTGALAAADGATLAEPTWTVRAELELDCPLPASAGAAVARAHTTAPSASMGFTILPPISRSNGLRQAGRGTAVRRPAAHDAPP